MHTSSRSCSSADARTPVEHTGGDDARRARTSPLAEVAKTMLDQYEHFDEIPDDLLPLARARADATERELLDLLVIPHFQQQPAETVEMFALRQDLVQIQNRIRFLDGVLARDDPSLDPLRADLARMRSDYALAVKELERKLARLP